MSCNLERRKYIFFSDRSRIRGALLASHGGQGHMTRRESEHGSNADARGNAGDC